MIDFSKIDKTIHEKGRLSIMTLLASRVEWGFQGLKADLQMSDGNLITHLRTLTEKGYVATYKDTEDKLIGDLSYLVEWPINNLV